MDAFDLLLVQKVAGVVVAAKKIGREGEMWPMDLRDQVGGLALHMSLKLRGNG